MLLAQLLIALEMIVLDRKQRPLQALTPWKVRRVLRAAVAHLAPRELLDVVEAQLLPAAVVPSPATHAMLAQLKAGECVRHSI